MIDVLERPAPVAAEHPLRRRGERLAAMAAGGRVELPPMDPKRARAIVERMAGVETEQPDGTH